MPIRPLLLCALLLGLSLPAGAEAQAMGPSALGRPAPPAPTQPVLLVFVQGMTDAEARTLRGALGEMLRADTIGLTDPRAADAIGSVAVALTGSSGGVVLQVAPRGSAPVVLNVPGSYLRGDASGVIARAVHGVWPNLDAAPPQASAPCHGAVALSTTRRSFDPTPALNAEVLDPWARFPPRHRTSALREVHDPWAVHR